MNRFRDAFICTGWIAGLICAAGLCWGLTAPLRTSLLQQAVNKAWTRTGESPRLEAPVANPGPRLSRLGAWYTCDEGRAVIFTIIADGIFLPCAAMVGSNGKVEKILPLTASGEKMMNRVSPGILQLHIRRIEHD